MQKFQKTGKEPAGAGFAVIDNLGFQDTADFRIEPILTIARQSKDLGREWNVCV